MNDEQLDIENEEGKQEIKEGNSENGKRMK